MNPSLYVAATSAGLSPLAAILLVAQVMERAWRGEDIQPILEAFGIEVSDCTIQPWR